jgi:hypothetical protein
MTVWGVSERGDRALWSRVGVAWEHRDGSIWARLEAVPLSGRLCLRDWAPGVESREQTPDLPVSEVHS